MKILMSIVLFVFILQGAFVNAEEVPRQGYFDKRIRSTVYEEGQIYRVAAKIGYASYLQFWEDEKLVSYFTGDASGWDVGSHGSVVALKPLVKNPSTNFIIITNKGRTYNLLFDLKTRKTKGHIIGLRFKYPKEERKKLKDKKEKDKKKVLKEQQAKKIQHLVMKEKNLAFKTKALVFNDKKKASNFNQRKRKRAEAEQIKILKYNETLRISKIKEHRRLEVEKIRERKAEKAKKSKERAELDPKKQPYKNYNYVAAGDESLRPVKMFDNGRFTFIKFAEGTQWPAIFRVRKGKEYLVNSTVKDNGWLVLPNLSKDWKIRLDDELLCIKKRG